MVTDTRSFKVTERRTIDLDSFDTSQKGDLEKDTSLQILTDLKNELFELQEKLYASNSKSLLILFQAMDGGGKDSAIKHVMSGLNPQGVQVYSFKQPSHEELDHDFLWRHYKALPERGRIGIHNRSHYENVLICKVHPEIAASESQVPVTNVDSQFWETRYKSIRNFEEHLNSTGTVILKFFLHISKDEQKERFLQRIDDPAKNWKFSSGDIKERELWDKYMQAYQDGLKETSTPNSPWYIIPGDKKWFARVTICQIIVDTLNSMDLDFPTLHVTERAALDESKQKLLSETS
ncbi:MAG TPA: polyphosphate kinase 2 family protein [Sphingobacteriaceae bacterium]|nr:polyphosphate kinase 2 family protein [Sphingobacteriaceae bacterium]